MLEVWISRDCLNTLLFIARSAHPNETFLLLRGEIRRGVVIVRELLFPPPTYTSSSSIAINPLRLPVDFSIIGVAHSHPSGALRPSITDLTSKFGAILVIIAYPYDSELCVAAYEFSGKRLRLRILESCNS